MLNKFDEIIGLSPPDGSLSGIIISSKTQQIRSMLFDHDTPNTLDSIITELSVLNNYTITKTTDTSFNFLSYNVITPKLEEVEFVPPVVKEDLIEKY
ncbi:MAG: hypothetical protein IPL10_10645 [Bacteroidetes bacterium]|nr:hypothetical protein [Bacteroidota bacterium]